MIDVNADEIRDREEYDVKAIPHLFVLGKFLTVSEITLAIAQGHLRMSNPLTQGNRFESSRNGMYNACFKKLCSRNILNRVTTST